MDESDIAAGRRISAPLLALWAGTGELGGWFDVLATWRRWAGDVTGRWMERLIASPVKSVIDSIDHALGIGCQLPTEWPGCCVRQSGSRGRRWWWQPSSLCSRAVSWEVLR
jgi:hypothetical protein